jgi:hypothetical protein
MGVLDNFLEGLKQGYMDQGGATPGNVFSGPTPREGDAPGGFAGGSGNFLGSLFGNVSDIALRTIPDIIKDPESFLNERGELSATRVLIPEYRREVQKENSQREEMRKAALAASAISQGKTFLESALGLHTNEAREAAQGVYGNDPRFAAAVQAANAESAAARPAAAEAGLLPSVAALAMPEDALKAGQSQFTDRLQREQNVQQGEITRQNQANQFGYTIRAQNNASGNAAGNIRLQAKLGRKGKRLGDRLKERGSTGAGGGVNTVALAGNTYGRKLLTDFANRSKTIADLDNMDEFRRMPHLFATGSGLQSTVEAGLEGLTGRTPSKFTRDRVALDQATGLFVANYMQSISGATIPDAEVQRLVKNVPNLATDSYSTYFTKLDAMREAALRDQQLLQAQMDALSKGDEVAANGLGEMRGKEASALADLLELKNGQMPSEADLQFLSPEERAELEAAMGMRQ